MATKFRALVSRWLDADITARRPVFSPTNGRWLWNEKKFMAQHTVRFNARVLKSIAAEALDVEKVSLEPLAEGASNKVFKIRGVGQRAIVKMPDPFIRPGLVTASEVATMDYLRTELGLPLPRVLASSSTADNPVGCEYILMREAEGQGLDGLWQGLNVDSKLMVVDEFVTMQQSVLEGGSRFGGYGSLYHTEDAIALGLRHKVIEPRGKTSPRFCIGPLATLRGADPSTKDHGPWQTPEEYLKSICDSSIAKIKSGEYGSATLNTPSFFPTKTSSDTSVEASLALWDQYRKVIPQIVSNYPATDQIACPALWHTDLHLGNIYVSPEGTITSLIDWQRIAALPLFLHAQIPSFLEIRGGPPLHDLPEDINSLPRTERNKLLERYNQTTLREYYLEKVRRDLPGCWKALNGESLTGLLRSAIAFSGENYNRETDTILLRDTLIRIQRNWAVLTAHQGKDAESVCPISFSEDVLALHRADGRIWNKYNELLQAYKIPIPKGGWVPYEGFKEEKAKLKAFVEEVTNFLVTEEERQVFAAKVDTWNMTR